jgi:hypothetical protein
MKLFITVLVLCLGSYVISFPLQAQDHHGSQQQSNEHTMLNQKDLQWQDGPPSLPKGIKVAIVEGDLSKEGPFTIRIQMPANYRIPPHWHPKIEHITVIEGSFYMGPGENFDMDKATMLTAGGFAVMPIKYVHYAFTKEGGTIQLHGTGPWGITYIKDTDDPRKQKQ